MESIIFGVKWGVIIFGILSLFIIFDDKEGFFTSIKTFLSFAIGGIIIGAILGAVFAFVLHFVLDKTTETNTAYCIENLQDNSVSTGSFFLGSGNIEGGMKYAFYHKVGDTTAIYPSYKLVLLDYESSIISYTEGKPKVLKTKKVFINKYWAQYALPLGPSPSYVIFVPKGTIKNNFTLDAQ